MKSAVLEPVVSIGELVKLSGVPTWRVRVLWDRDALGVRRCRAAGQRAILAEDRAAVLALLAQDRAWLADVAGQAACA